MTTQRQLLTAISLSGLDMAPSQVRGAIRLVPLLRQRERGDLRLTRRSYQDTAIYVSLDGPLLDPGVKYVSYVPHGLVLSWEPTGAVAARGTQMAVQEGKSFRFGSSNIRVLPRMAKREAGNQLRFLPLHLAMEGFLSLYFSGPEIAWTEYSRRAIRQGLNPRWESVVDGRAIAGFEDALRTFEIHDGQCGVLVFVAGSLASAFVVPSAEDYKTLHRTLIEDFYGELVYQYALYHSGPLALEARIDERSVGNLADLREELNRTRTEWANYHGVMAGDLIGRAARSQFVYQAGAFTLQRFMTDLDPKNENHLGEAIVRDDGTLEYLKTYRLSAAQTRRAYLLSQLAEADWNLDDAATNLKTTRPELLHRLEKAGFGYLIAEHVLAAARKQRKEPRRSS
jgi:hypothetical protein